MGAGVGGGAGGEGCAGGGAAFCAATAPGAEDGFGDGACDLPRLERLAGGRALAGGLDVTFPAWGGGWLATCSSGVCPGEPAVAPSERPRWWNMRREKSKRKGQWY